MISTVVNGPERFFCPLRFTKLLSAYRNAQATTLMVFQYERRANRTIYWPIHLAGFQSHGPLAPLAVSLLLRFGMSSLTLADLAIRQPHLTNPAP